MASTSSDEDIKLGIYWSEHSEIGEPIVPTPIPGTSTVIGADIVLHTAQGDIIPNSIGYAKIGYARKCNGHKGFVYANQYVPEPVHHRGIEE